MGSPGIVMRLDELNRVVIPRAICRAQGWGPGTAVEIATVRGTVVLKQANARCVLCGGGPRARMVQLRGRYVCKTCLAELNRLQNGTVTGQSGPPDPEPLAPLIG